MAESPNELRARLESEYPGMVEAMATLEQHQVIADRHGVSPGTLRNWRLKLGLWENRQNKRPETREELRARLDRDYPGLTAHIDSGAMPADLVERWGMNRGTLRRWRRQLGQGSAKWVAETPEHLRARLDREHPGMLAAIEAGQPVSDAAKTFGVVYASLSKWVKRLGIKATPARRGRRPVTGDSRLLLTLPAVLLGLLVERAEEYGMSVGEVAIDILKAELGAD